ncbi:MAG: ATP-binding protein [Bacteroidaceae bacterium]|nr:ATP-binding protein [Bacteroidaceae bacterium]
MLLRLIMKNFLSFYNETVFDMFPNPKREHFTSHIYTDGATPLLKEAAVYGSNASGKTNLIKAFQFLKFFVTDKDFHQRIEFEDYRYSLSSDDRRPFELTVEFRSGRTYIYKVAINGDIDETLWVSGLGREENRLLFHRSGAAIDGPVVINTYSSKALLEKSNHSSVLSLNKDFPVLGGEEVAEAFHWFSDVLTVATLNYQISALIALMSENKPLLDFTNNLLVWLRVNEGLEVREFEFNKWLETKNGRNFARATRDGVVFSDGYKLLTGQKDRRNEFNIVKNGGEQVVQEFLFREKGIDGHQGYMDIDSQSDGTVRLLTLIPLIYEAIRNGRVVVIDEIDNSFHSELIFELVRFYAESSSTGQLIFTTHETRLMNQQLLMRVDEMWKVEKHYGSSLLSSFNDYKIHGTINVEHGYREGRYGGIPDIGQYEKGAAHGIQ